MQLADFGTMHRGLVVAVDTHGVTVEIPLLAPNAPMGPYPSAVPNLAIGEAVLLAQISTSRDSLAVIGRIPGRAPTIAEIATLTATLTAIQAAATALTTRVTTAEGNITTNTTNITANAVAIAAHGTRLTTDEVNIAANAAAITALTTRVTTAETNITAIQTAATALAARTTVLEDTTRIGATRYAFQAADTAGIVSQTTPQATNLTLPVIAGATYEWEALVIVNALPAANCKITFAVPAGTSNPRVAPWFSGDPAGNSAIWHDVFDGPSYVMGGKTGGGMMSSRPAGGLVVGATAGNFAIQYSQNVSDPSTTIFNAGGKLKMTRIA